MDSLAHGIRNLRAGGVESIINVEPDDGTIIQSEMSSVLPYAIGGMNKPWVFPSVCVMAASTQAVLSSHRRKKVQAQINVTKST